MRSGSGHLIIGVIILVLGIFFLLNSLGAISFSFGDFLNILWPIVVILIGIRILRGGGLPRQEFSADTIPKKYNKFMGEMTYDAGGMEIDGLSLIHI